MSKKLYKPKKGKMIGGVAIGLAEYFGINVVFVRFVWVLLLLPGGAPGIVPYVIFWVLMPSEDKITEQAH